MLVGGPEWLRIPTCKLLQSASSRILDAEYFNSFRESGELWQWRPILSFNFSEPWNPVLHSEESRSPGQERSHISQLRMNMRLKGVILNLFRVCAQLAVLSYIIKTIPRRRDELTRKLYCRRQTCRRSVISKDILTRECSSCQADQQLVDFHGDWSADSEFDDFLKLMGDTKPQPGLSSCCEQFKTVFCADRWFLIRYTNKGK